MGELGRRLKDEGVFIGIPVSLVLVVALVLSGADGDEVDAVAACAIAAGTFIAAASLFARTSLADLVETLDPRDRILASQATAHEARRAEGLALYLTSLGALTPLLRDWWAVRSSGVAFIAGTVAFLIAVSTAGRLLQLRRRVQAGPRPIGTTQYR